MDVKEMLTLNKDFKEFKFITEHVGLENEIRNIQILEVPDGVYWVKPCDFIVTTGYALKKNDITFEYFIKTLIERGVSALGIKLGRYIDDIPEKLLRYAESQNFPIINIPTSVNYNSILQPVFSKLDSDNNYNFYLLKQFRDDLRALIKQNYNITSITNIISRYIGHNIYIFWEKGINIINDSSNINSLKAKKAIKDSLTQIYSSEESTKLEYCDNSYVVFKIESIHTSLAFLCVDLKTEELLTNADVEIIREAIPVIAVYLLSHSYNTEKYYKTIDDFYFNIITGGYVGNALKLMEEISYFGVNPNTGRYIAIVDSSIRENDVFDKLQKKIISAMEANESIFYYKNFDKRAVIIVELKSHVYNDKAIYSTFSKLFSCFKSVYPEHSFFAGISKVCTDVKQLKSAYEEADFSLKIGCRLNPNNSVYFYGDFIIYHMLYGVLNDPTLRKIYKGTVQLIKKHDSENNDEFFITLQALASCDFSVSGASDKLFIHRNTLYKRIAKINSLLGFNIDEHNNRIILQIALKLHELID